MNLFRLTISIGMLAIPAISIAQVTGPTCMFRGRILNRVGDLPQSVAIGDLDGDLDNSTARLKKAWKKTTCLCSTYS